MSEQTALWFDSAAAQEEQSAAGNRVMAARESTGDYARRTYEMRAREGEICASHFRCAAAALRALEQIRALSNYPGKGRSTFADLADARRKINKLACDALREEG